MESYSNDRLMHTLCNEQEVPAEIVNLAKSIVLERGLSQRNIIERVKTFRLAQQEASKLSQEIQSMETIKEIIQEKYLLESEVAAELVMNATRIDNIPVMMRCLGFFASGIVSFYVLRIIAAFV